MILGVGTDIVAIARIAALLERHPHRAIQRIFSDEEASYCLRRASPAASFAVRFAAKEAFYKAMGTGIGPGGRWRDLEVVRDESGAPRIRLRGTAAREAARRGLKRVHVSLSHTEETALAFVVLEGLSNGSSRTHRPNDV